MNAEYRELWGYETVIQFIQEHFKIVIDLILVFIKRALIWLDKIIYLYYVLTFSSLKRSILIFFLSQLCVYRCKICLRSYLNDSCGLCISWPMDTCMYPTMRQPIMQRVERKRQWLLRHGSTSEHVYVFAHNCCFIWLLHRYGRWYIGKLILSKHCIIDKSNINF